MVFLLLLNSSLFDKHFTRSGRLGLDLSVVAVAAVVPASFANVCRNSTNYSLKSFSYSFPSTRATYPVAVEEFPLEWLEDLRKRFESHGFSRLFNGTCLASH